jgi:amphi-Trp domain-containing protein
MPNKSNYAHNFVSDPDEVSGFLSALQDGFRDRRITLGSDGREAVLKPGEILDMTLESAQRKGRRRLTVTISWPESDGPSPKHHQILDLPPAES